MKSPKQAKKPPPGPPEVAPPPGVVEDEVGRRDDGPPELVHPGTLIEQPAHVPGREVRELDDEALIADRAAQRTSDRRDAADGMDPSDTIAVDPDAVGGKPSSS